MKLRGYIASEFLKYHGPTDADAGRMLVVVANQLSFTNRERSVPGSTLRKWMGGDSVPQWAVKTMVHYILEKGYIPDSDEQLDAIMSYLLVDRDVISEDEVRSLPLLQHLNCDDIEQSLSRIWHAKF